MGMADKSSLYSLCYQLLCCLKLQQVSDIDDALKMFVVQWQAKNKIRSTKAPEYTSRHSLFGIPFSLVKLSWSIFVFIRKEIFLEHV